LKTLLTVSIFGLLTLLVACGGGSNSNSGSGTQPTPVAIQGAWEVVALSTVNPTVAYPNTLIEANLSQTENSVSAGAQSVALVPFFSTQGGNNWGVGNPTVNVCGGTSDTIDASITNGTSLSFTLTQSGPSGTYTVSGTATISSDGKSMTGNYNSSADCGQPDDAGTFTGTLLSSFSGTYAATFSDGSTASLTVTEDANYNLQISGTEQGQAFSLAGEAIGGGFSVSGVLPTSAQVTYEGVYLTSQLTTLITNVNDIGTKTGDFVTLGSDATIGIVVPN
jgi:hypothetical protein